jgi:2-keto-3-deoxy-L-rhamnonate aldolase RhmA
MVFSLSSADNPLKAKLKSGKVVIGTWINTFRDPMAVRLAAVAGFDYVFIDQEHTSLSNSDLTDMCMIARECGVAPIVRVVDPENLTRNGRLLDCGVVGLIIPHVQNVEQCTRVVNSTRYLDGGTRGYVGRCLNTNFQPNNEAMIRHSEANTVMVAQFEDTDAIANAEKILSVKGVDMAIIGRGDLATSMGLPGKTSDPRVTEQVEKVVAAAAKVGVASGLLVQNVDDAKAWIAKGVRCITYSNESSILLSGYQKAISALRED